MFRRSYARIQRFYQRSKAACAVAQKREFARFDVLRARFYRQFWQSAARAAGADLDDLGYEYFRISRGRQHTYTHFYDVATDNHLLLKIAGHKLLTHQLLAEHGFPVPRHQKYTLGTMQKAVDFLRSTPGSIVVKPCGGAAGLGVAVGIRSERELHRASQQAALRHSYLIAEEEVPGSSYRLLYLNGEFIDAVRRDPPAVVGDGVSNLKKLIRTANEFRLESQPATALSPICMDTDCLQKLKKQGLSLRSVPEKGQKVTVKAVVNQNASTENHVVRDRVHPDVIRLGQEVVKTLGINLAGLDIITPDIGAPIEACGGRINEVNGTPGLHHHVLVAEAEKRVPVGELVLDFLLQQPPSPAPEPVPLAQGEDFS